MKIKFSLRKSHFHNHECMLVKDNGDILTINGRYVVGVGFTQEEARKNLQALIHNHDESTRKKCYEMLTFVTKN